MSTTPKVSVLTPIYNVEKYLRQCLDSLAAQTLKEIEFICINDGSTDNSLEIVQEYAYRDDRFVIIDKQNSGYGISMNMGLEKARGEYIGIVESDDYAEPTMFEVLYSIAQQNNCDIARGNRFRLTENSDTFDEVLKDLPYNQVFKPLELQEIFVPAPCIWTQIYRRQFLAENEIRFLETPGASFQDTGFVYKSYIAANRMILTKDAFLHYRMDNANSSVKSSSKVFCVVDEFHSIDNFIEERPDALNAFKYNLEALRYQAYQWNYSRLGWRARHEFIGAFADDLKKAQAQGRLSDSAFTVREWDRVMRLIDDPEQVFDNEAPLVSVIVPAYNCEKHIEYTLELLKKQSLKRIEVIVVNDGSEDNTQQIVEDFCATDGRFTLINQTNQGLGGARNTGLDNASGKYISFIDGEDGVPQIGLEMLYRTAEMEEADCAIGVIEEFSPIEKHQFERTKSLSKKKLIEKYDLDLVWSFSVNNKLFKRSIIEDNRLRFTDTFAEDGPFCMSYLYKCKKIVGCPYITLNYRRDLFWDGFSLTRESSGAKVHDLVNNHEFIINAATDSLKEDIEAATTELERRKLACLQYVYINELHRRLASYLIDLQYRQLWLLDEETISYLINKVEEHRAFISDEDWQRMAAWHNDLPLESGLLQKNALSETPLITIVITDSIRQSDYLEMLDCIYHNGFPRFEIIVNGSLEATTPQLFQKMPNLRFIQANRSNAEFKNAAIDNARAPMVLFIEDRVFPHIGSLKKLWTEASNTQADFVVAKIRKVEREREIGLYYRSQKVLFDKRHSDGFSYRDDLNQLDCSLNNKLIKTASVKRKNFQFSNSSIEDCKKLYELLEFKKMPGIIFFTDISEAEFLSGTDKALYEKCRLERYRARVFDEKALSKKASETLAPLPTRVRKKILRTFPKKKVLFFSNRGMSDNMRLIYSVLDGEKVSRTELPPHSAAYDAEVETLIRRSKLIVTDDTCQYLRSIKLGKDQHVVQLWHALGAFKKFGLDNLRVGPSFERKAHDQYDAVIVSSDFIRPIYAQAFGIPVSKVHALGSSRTDILLDASINELKQATFYASNPELKGKTIVLYCPTFRQENGKQCLWNPCIDWDSLNGTLKDSDTVMIVKAHPLERFDLLEGRNYSNILRMDDCTSNDLLIVADLLVTDYSSIVFDAALLNKPTLFYCPDLEQYQTGFYINFPNDLYGDVIESPTELPDAITNAISAGIDENRLKLFKKKFLEACDGHSTERIVMFLHQYL